MKHYLNIAWDVADILKRKAAVDKLLGRADEVEQLICSITILEMLIGSELRSSDEVVNSEEDTTAKD